MLVLTEMTEEMITDPPKIGVKLKADNVDIAYPPLFQSGGHYDLKLNAACDENNLHDGKGRSHCSWYELGVRASVSDQRTCGQLFFATVCSSDFGRKSCEGMLL